MDKIKKILVPIDGSRNSVRGLNMAITIATQSNAKIVCIHVIYEPTHSEFRGIKHAKKVINAEIKKIMKNARKAASENGVDFRKKIVRGDVGYNIVKFAHDKKERFDMVVIGSRGRGSLKEMFFGSTSNYVMHASRIPVLIVK